MSNRQKQEKGSFVEAFRDLSGAQKIGAFAALLVLLFLVFSLASSLFSGDDESEQESPDSPPAASYEPEPVESAEAIDSSASATALPSPTDVPISEEELPNFDGEELPDLSGGEMSVADQRDALEAAQTGIDEFLDWDPNEPLDKRLERIGKFFVEGSSMDERSPTVSDIAGEYIDPESGKPQFAYMGEVTSAMPGSGTEERYRTSLGIVLRTQMFDPLTGEEASPVDESSATYTVDMTKTDGSWKIISIVVE